MYIHNPTIYLHLNLESERVPYVMTKLTFILSPYINTYIVICIRGNVLHSYSIYLPKHHRDEITLFSSNVVLFVSSTYVCTTLFSCNVALFVSSTYICTTYIHIKYNKA